MSRVYVALSTCPDEPTAREIAGTLVEERLAACVNIVPGLTSIYRWEGAIESDSECLLILKTGADQLDTLASRLAALHPYDVPEFLAFPAERGAVPYMTWVLEETGRTA